MNPATPIILADDHPTFLLGLRHAIKEDREFDIVGEANDGAAAFEMIQSIMPDIAVVDWSMPVMNGLELTKKVRAERLPTRIIILTMHNEEALVNSAVESGVSGFVLKEHAVEHIIDCLREVRSGRTFLSPSVAHHILQRSRRKADMLDAMPSLSSLTQREIEIVREIATGQSTAEIAGTLGVSPRTVETHRRNACEKLGLHGSYSLMQFALEHREALSEL